MPATIQCSIVTPGEAVFEGEITYASLPAWDGQLGVMTGQSPILTRLGVGSLRLDFEEGGSRWYLVDGGFGQVQDDHLTIITEAATSAESLSLKNAEAELAEASARISEAGEDRVRAERDQARALAKVRLAREAAGRGI